MPAKKKSSDVVEDKPEVESKKPILIVPLTRKEYPRIEAYIMGAGVNVYLKAPNDSGKIITKDTGYCGMNPGSIVHLVDKMAIAAKMGRYLKDDYESTLKEFTELIREHHEFMKSIYLEGV